jgi:CHAT domain-containing protein
MRPPLHGNGAAALLLLTLTSFRLAAQPATPAEPATVVQELFARYVTGDLRGASRLWVAGAPAEDFIRRHRVRVEKRCLRLETLKIDVTSTIAVDVTWTMTMDVTSTMTLQGVAPGSPEWWESSHSRISLQREGEEWRIAAWEPRERELIEGLVTAADPAEQAALLESSTELQTTTFVRLAGQRAIELLNQGHFDTAAKLTSAAAAVAERIGDPAAIAAALSTGSVELRLRNDLDGAASLGGQAVSFAEGGGDPDVLAAALVRLARTRERLDTIPDPELTARALGLSDDLEELAIAAHAAVHLGRAYELRNQFREAFRYAQLAFRFAEESGDRAARVSAAILLNGAFVWIREPEVAFRYSRRAAKLAEEGGYADTFVYMLEPQVNDIARNDPAGALHFVNEALGQARTATSRAMLLQMRSGLYRDAGRFEDAERDLEQVVILRPVDGSTRQRIALDHAMIAYRRGDYEAVMDRLPAARGPDSKYDRNARQLQALTLRRSGRIDEAHAIAEELTRIDYATPLSDPQRSLFNEVWQSDLRLLTELLVAQGDSAAAFRTGEQVKGKELAAALSHGGKAPPPTARKTAGERAIEKQIHELNRGLAGNTLTGPAAAAARKQLGEARANLLDLRQRLYAEGPAASDVQSVDVCVDELPADLDDVTIVSYVISEDRTIVFVLEPARDGRRKITVRSIEINFRELHDRTSSLATLVEQRNLRAPAVAAEIYDLLIGPIEPFVREARSLCIIPDAFLWRVPFQALGPEGGPLLVDHVPLFYAPSVTVLASVRPHRPDGPREKPRLLAFANPAVGAETASLYRAFDPDAALGAIPETESEVRAIGKIYGRDASRIYVGKTARETTLKEEAPGYDILHIATHGVVYESAPMFSALLLTASPEDESDDGVLEAREIAALALNTDLTVLSACETGRANVSGSGVIGLSWAFLVAGCPTTVVTQWKSHSAASAVLMVEFHRQLVRGHSRPEALRRAQLALRRDRRYRHPFYWAPFMMVGRP